MPASLYLEEELLKGTLTGATFTAPAKLFVSLNTEKVEAGHITKKTTGTTFEAGEPTGANGWARIEVKGEAAQWETIEKGEGASSSPTIIKNKNAVKFKTLTGGEYTLESFGIFDALTAGHMLYFGSLTTKVTINTATTEFTIPAKQLVIECE